MSSKAMIVCVLATRAQGKGADNMEYRVAVVPKESLPPNDRDATQSFKLSRLKPIFEGNKNVKMATGYRGVSPIINEMKGHGRLKLGEVFYNCGNLYFDGSSAPIIVEDGGQADNSESSGRSKGSLARMERRRRSDRNAPSSQGMD